MVCNSQYIKTAYAETLNAQTGCSVQNTLKIKSNPPKTNTMKPEANISWFVN